MTRSSDVNRTTNHIVIQHLEHFEFYFIWLQTLPTRGLGPKSKEVKIRTLEKGESYKIEYFMSFLLRALDFGCERSTARHLFNISQVP